METNEKGTNFNEKQTLETIKAAIATSQNRLMDDGVLLLTWGLAFSISNFWRFYESAFLTVWWFRNLMSIMKWIMGIGAIALTAYYIFFRKNKVTSFTSISTRYVWIGVILAYNITVIITKGILNEVNFLLLQPLQMVLIGFALFVTGGIYRYWLLAVSGIVMWIAAAISANFDLNTQFLIRAIAELLCFIVPGFLMIRTKTSI